MLSRSLRFLLLLLLFAAHAASFAADGRQGGHDAYEAIVLRVQDGDTLLVRRIGQTRPHRVRLSGIDAPERGQAHADESRAALEALVAGKRVRVAPVKKDPWGRVVAAVSVGERDVGLAMVESGHAWYFRRYRSDLPQELRKPYERAEAQARKAGIGLWGDPAAQAPWEYRLRQRDQRREAAERERLSPS